MFIPVPGMAPTSSWQSMASCKGSVIWGAWMFLPKSTAYKTHLSYLAVPVTLTSPSHCHLFYLLCSAVSPMSNTVLRPTGRQRGTEAHRNGDSQLRSWVQHQLGNTRSDLYVCSFSVFWVQKGLVLVSEMLGLHDAVFCAVTDRWEDILI